MVFERLCRRSDACTSDALLSTETVNTNKNVHDVWTSTLKLNWVTPPDTILCSMFLLSSLPDLPPSASLNKSLKQQLCLSNCHCERVPEDKSLNDVSFTCFLLVSHFLYVLIVLNKFSSQNSTACWLDSSKQESWILRILPKKHSVPYWPIKQQH